MKFILKLSLATVSALLIVSCDKQDTAATQTGTVITTNDVVAVAKPNPLFEKLMGRWERTDGDYALELRSVDAEGKFDAGYFNPGKINVERAQAVVGVSPPPYQVPSVPTCPASVRAPFPT